jgi:hypothetical protein
MVWHVAWGGATTSDSFLEVPAALGNCLCLPSGTLVALQVSAGPRTCLLARMLACLHVVFQPGSEGTHSAAEMLRSTGFFHCADLERCAGCNFYLGGTSELR